MSSASTTASLQGGFTETAFEEFLRGRDEPTWLIERRREAFARSQAFAWPSARDEEWRRSDLRAFKLERFTPRLGELSSDARSALDPLWQNLSTHYAAGIEHVNGAALKKRDRVHT